MPKSTKTEVAIECEPVPVAVQLVRMCDTDAFHPCGFEQLLVFTDELAGLIPPITIGRRSHSFHCG